MAAVKESAKTNTRSIGMGRYFKMIEEDTRASKMTITAILTGWVTDTGMALKKKPEWADQIKSLEKKSLAGLSPTSQSAPKPFDVDELIPRQVGRRVKMVAAHPIPDMPPLFKLTTVDGTEVLVVQWRYNLVKGEYPKADAYLYPEVEGSKFGKLPPNFRPILFSDRSTVAIVMAFNPNAK